MFNESNYDDQLIEAARNSCNNCGARTADLHRVHEAAAPFYACDTCMEDISAVFEREAAGEASAADEMICRAYRKHAGTAPVAAPAANFEPHCEHYNVDILDTFDVDDERVSRYRDITCLDCGADLRENRRGELVPRKRRAA